MKPPRKKVCPFLEKYGIHKNKLDLPEWQAQACTHYCPLYDEDSDTGHCIEDYPGKGILKSDRKKLEKATLPCPHCKKREPHSLNEDGDWEFSCGYVAYTLPILPLRKGRR